MINSRFSAPWLILSLTCCVLFTTACKSTKAVISKPDADLGVMTAEDHLKALVREQVQADWFNGTARLNYDDGSMSVGATATIKMEKDKAIWMSVRKFGFELARALVTPDSLFILDRINSEYAAEPLSYVEDRFKLPADLGMLQQMLMGNPVFLTTENSTALLSDDELHWSANKGTDRNDYWFQYPSYQLNRLAIEQPEEQRALRIGLLDYREAGTNRDFSYLRQIEVASQETGDAAIDIEFTKVELNVPTSITFDVPSRYQRMD